MIQFIPCKPSFSLPLFFIFVFAWVCVGASLKPRQIKLLMFALYKLKKMTGFEHPEKNFKSKKKIKKTKKMIPLATD